MTLDFKKFIRNAIKKQMSIQHWESNVQIFKREELPQNVMQKIQAIEGNNAPIAGDYFLWFSGNDITKELIDKTIFKIVNSALGTSANNMREGDIKMIDLTGSVSDTAAPDQTSDEVNTITNPEADTANEQAIGDLVTGDSSADVQVQESVEQPQAGEKFCYLMITMK